MSETQEKWSVDQIMHEMSREAALDLWRGLPAPTLDELDGEYKGHVHDGGDEAVRQAKTKFFFYSPCGFWLGKAYTPGDGDKGEGHNSFHDDEGTVRRFRRFATEIGPSLLDGRPALIMYYRAFDNYAGKMDLVDEIRRVDDGVYLCNYTGTENVPGFATKKPGQERSEPELFALTGPEGPWVGVDDPQLEARQ
jgi:hypothetical protein